MCAWRDVRLQSSEWYPKAEQEANLFLFPTPSSPRPTVILTNAIFLSEKGTPTDFTREEQLSEDYCCFVEGIAQLRDVVEPLRPRTVREETQIRSYRIKTALIDYVEHSDRLTITVYSKFAIFVAVSFHLSYRTQLANIKASTQLWLFCCTDPDGKGNRHRFVQDIMREYVQRYPYICDTTGLSPRDAYSKQIDVGLDIYRAESIVLILNILRHVKAPNLAVLSKGIIKDFTATYNHCYLHLRDAGLLHCIDGITTENPDIKDEYRANRPGILLYYRLPNAAAMEQAVAYAKVRAHNFLSPFGYRYSPIKRNQHLNTDLDYPNSKRQRLDEATPTSSSLVSASSMSMTLSNQDPHVSSAPTRLSQSDSSSHKHSPAENEKTIQRDSRPTMRELALEQLSQQAVLYTGKHERKELSTQKAATDPRLRTSAKDRAQLIDPTLLVDSTSVSDKPPLISPMNADNSNAANSIVPDPLAAFSAYRRRNDSSQSSRTVSAILKRSITSENTSTASSTVSENSTWRPEARAEFVAFRRRKNEPRSVQTISGSLRHNNRAHSEGLASPKIEQKSEMSQTTASVIFPVKSALVASKQEEIATTAPTHFLKRVTTSLTATGPNLKNAEAGLVFLAQDNQATLQTSATLSSTNQAGACATVNADGMVNWPFSPRIVSKTMRDVNISTAQNASFLTADTKFTLPEKRIPSDLVPQNTADFSKTAIAKFLNEEIREVAPKTEATVLESKSSWKVPAVAQKPAALRMEKIHITPPMNAQTPAMRATVQFQVTLPTVVQESVVSTTEEDIPTTISVKPSDIDIIQQLLNSERTLSKVATPSAQESTMAVALAPTVGTWRLTKHETDGTVDVVRPVMTVELLNGAIKTDSETGTSAITTFEPSVQIRLPEQTAINALGQHLSPDEVALDPGTNFTIVLPTRANEPRSKRRRMARRIGENSIVRELPKVVRLADSLQATIINSAPTELQPAAKILMSPPTKPSHVSTAIPETALTKSMIREITLAPYYESRPFDNKTYGMTVTPDFLRAAKAGAKVYRKKLEEERKIQRQAGGKNAMLPPLLSIIPASDPDTYQKELWREQIRDGWSVTVMATGAPPLDVVRLPTTISHAQTAPSLVCYVTGCDYRIVDANAADAIDELERHYQRHVDEYIANDKESQERAAIVAAADAAAGAVPAEEQQQQRLVLDSANKTKVRRRDKSGGVASTAAVASAAGAQRLPTPVHTSGNIDDLVEKIEKAALLWKMFQLNSATLHTSTK
ncbi:uncharacterized protein V1518DRAFT_409040 [Limtongia smithiae]|uniref:uncharacterized protein n=1 Tax=Limtongia smithiae TaxID=1125753 RepID=UPI0034CF8134